MTEPLPYEIGRPQPAVAAVLGEVRGRRVLDVGCGSGELTIELARRGFDVTGVDVSPDAIAEARGKAERAGVTVDFQVGDATTLSFPPFDAIFDSGCLHTLDRYGQDVDAYLSVLPRLAAPGATVFVLAISADSAGGWGLTEEFLRAAFGEPAWSGTRVEEAEVVARTMVHRGFLLRAVRAPRTA